MGAVGDYIVCELCVTGHSLLFAVDIYFAVNYLQTLAGEADGTLDIVLAAVDGTGYLLAEDGLVVVDGVITVHRHELVIVGIGHL
jgi:hypothetical protein